jgi:predicted metal-dependent peptidase
MRERFDKIIERWFVSEPALFVIICSHEFVPNDKIKCPVRSGCGRVEYNPHFTREMSDTALEEALKTEAIRILLKHPYERRPDGCGGEAISVGSNLAISDNYPFARLYMKTPADFGFKTGLSYEVYSRFAQQKARETEERTADTDLSELWDDDPLQVALINGLIDGIKDWGSLAGDMAERVKASTRASIDWKKVLFGFRAQVLSQERHLTRMKPSRRTGFDNMGSIRKFTSRLLIALDVSGSISSEAISYFLGVVNSAFKYGITEIEVIQFETMVTASQTLKHAIKETIAVGRGGTDFQAPIDYAAERDFDGLVIVTDGEAPEPEIPAGFRSKILWVCESEYAYRQNEGWMHRSGRVCTMKLR